MTAVRLQDVADLAGVSLKTVSNVVREKPYVSDKMREKVQKAIKELGYVPNVTARRLATGKNGVIELAIPELSSPYYAQLAEYMLNEAQRYKYRLFIQQTHHCPVNERAILTDQKQGLIDGIIFDPHYLEPNEISLLRDTDIPLVLIGESSPPLSVDHVVIDTTAAAHAATQHLIDGGCKRIAILASREASAHTVARRLAGYESALMEAGLQVDPALYFTAKNTGIEESALRAERTIADALEGGVRFDGLLCYNDFTAVGAMQALRDAGLRIPEDVAVVGWNDVLMTRFTTPGLTTVAPDTKALCEAAVSMMMDRIDGHDGVGRHRLVDYSLTVRGSTRPVPQAQTQE